MNMIMKKISIIIIMVQVLFSCKKNDFKISNLNSNEITILGHGGMGIGSSYPMNSYESIMKSMNRGAQGSEIDVQLTKDSVLVAYHNNDLSDQTNLVGLINDLNWSEIKDAQYTVTPYLNYSILALDELFSNIENIKDYKFTFDCKLVTNNNMSDYQDAYVNALSKIIDVYDLKDNVYIESQSTNFLVKLKNKNVDYKLFVYPGTFEDGLETALSLDLYGITISTSKITKEQIEIAHNNNLYIAIWNTHSRKKNREAINKSPDFIQTDKVEYLVKLLD